MTNIFVWCAICGYVFPIIFLWYPVWPIRTIALAVLAVFTWLYAINTSMLKVVYSEIHQTDDLISELEGYKKMTTKAANRAETAGQPIDDMAKEIIHQLDTTDDPDVRHRLEELKSYLGQLEQNVNSIRRTLDNIYSDSKKDKE